MIPESNRNKKDFFSGNNSANEKPRTLFTIHSPPPISSSRSGTDFFPCLWRLVYDLLELQPQSVILCWLQKNFFFSVEISSSLSVFFSQWSTADHEYPTFTHAIPLPRMSFLTCLKRVPTQFSFLPTLFSKMQFKYYLLQSRVITISGVLLVLRSYFLYLNH